ncbi:MAG: hypothetical protein MZV64_06565 [Ignavibacteriales bacterium]|nr:hypothetical protein [Ignavibacteriales bacterium]
MPCSTCVEARAGRWWPRAGAGGHSRQGNGAVGRRRIAKTGSRVIENPESPAAGPQLDDFRFRVARLRFRIHVTARPDRSWHRPPS